MPKWKGALVDIGELRKTWGGVFDSRAILTLHKLIEKGYIKNLVGPVKEGKESRIFWGEGRDFPVAIKIYAVETSDFKKIKNYIVGDPRFRGLSSDKRKLLDAWCSKEFKNMLRGQEAGVLCPKPIIHLNNVLVMEFIGEPPAPAPRLVDSELSQEEAKITFENLLHSMEKLWRSAKLVHGDFSEYNVLWWRNVPYIIDFSQSVVRDHPLAESLLQRDVKNFCRYFSKQGIRCREDEILEKIKSGE